MMHRSEPFWLAVALAAIHALLLTFLIVVAWRSPYLLMRLPEKSPPVPAVTPAAATPEKTL